MKELVMGNINIRKLSVPPPFISETIEPRNLKKIGNIGPHLYFSGKPKRKS